MSAESSPKHPWILTSCEKRTEIFIEAKLLGATEVKCALLKDQVAIPIVGIALDLGTSRVKAICFGVNGELIGNWSISVTEAFEDNGYVDLEKYSSRSLAVLSSIFQSTLPLNNLRFVIVDGIYPSTVLCNSGNPLFDAKGLTYTTNEGQPAVNEYASKGITTDINALRNIPVAPYTGAEIIRALRTADAIYSDEAIAMGLADYVITYLTGGNPQEFQHTPYNAQEYNAFLERLGYIFQPAKIKLLPHNNPTKYFAGNAQPDLLKELGLNINHSVTIMNRGVDGLAINHILSLARKRMSRSPKRSLRIGRYKAESTLAFHVITDHVSRKSYMGFILQDGSDWSVGKASNDGVAELRKWTYNQGYSELPIDDKTVYEEFFRKQNNETEDQYYSRLDRETLKWMKQYPELFNKIMLDLGIWVFGKDRSGKGPQTAGLSRGGLPKNPQAFWYLLKESSIFSMRKNIEDVQGYTGEKTNASISLGPINRSPLWQRIHKSVIGMPLYQVMFDGRSIQEPSLISMGLTALRELGEDRLASQLEERISFKPLRLFNLPLLRAVIERRYREYLDIFQ